MWTRAELKDRAKFAFKRNYWRSVLISLLLALLIRSEEHTSELQSHA